MVSWWFQTSTFHGLEQPSDSSQPFPVSSVSGRQTSDRAGHGDPNRIAAARYSTFIAELRKKRDHRWRALEYPITWKRYEKSGTAALGPRFAEYGRCSWEALRSYLIFGGCLLLIFALWTIVMFLPLCLSLWVTVV